jgi:hypothetical protein
VPKACSTVCRRRREACGIWYRRACSLVLPARDAPVVTHNTLRLSLELFSEAIVAIDGSKFKAINNRGKNFTDHTLKARMQQLEESIARYLADLDRADRDPSLVTEARVEHLKQKVETVKAQMRRLKQIGERMAAALDGQVSLTDPDAGSMATSGHRTGIVGYKRADGGGCQEPSDRRPRGHEHR